MSTGDPGRPVKCSGLTRRTFLQLGSALSTGLILPPALALSRLGSVDRRLAFHNTHTGETVSSLYWAEGEYLPEGLADINHLLRDHRSDESHPIDTGLLDLLYVLQARSGSQKPFEVISGYRSPATNKALRSKTTGVAKRSYHVQGKAIDIRLPGCELKDLHTVALELKAGGVGYYPDSGFIHVDTGPVRRW